MKLTGVISVTVLLRFFPTVSTTAFAVPMNNRQQNHPQQQREQKQGNSAATTRPSSSSSLSFSVEDYSQIVNGEWNDSNDGHSNRGKLEELKIREAALSRRLAEVRREKLSALRAKPLTIGVVGFGRFGQFIARTFAKHGRVIVTSRSDYSDVANDMGVKYVPLSDPDAFMNEGLDVILFAVSILSFEQTVQSIAPYIQSSLDRRSEAEANSPGPLVVDVLSVKEHPRQVLLDLLPQECDILCTHPMFGPDSGKNGWHGLTFVYERTRIDGVLLDPSRDKSFHQLSEDNLDDDGTFVDIKGKIHDLHENSDAHVEGMDRMERFLSIWEEEGCSMVAMSCAKHDAHAANSQFITHLMGRILGQQGLAKTPIDTKGFESVLKLIGTTNADSFELFYGLYKYNQNSVETIMKLMSAMDDVVEKLKEMEMKDENAPKWFEKSLKHVPPQRTIELTPKMKSSSSEDEKKEEVSNDTTTTQNVCA